MKAVALLSPGEASVINIAEPKRNAGDVLLRVEMVGLCGTDLNSYRGNNPLVDIPTRDRP